MMNIKHISGIMSLCTLCMAGTPVSYKRDICDDYKKVNKVVTDDTIRTKGCQDKACSEALMKLNDKAGMLSDLLYKYHNEDNDDLNDTENKSKTDKSSESIPVDTLKDEDSFLMRIYE